MTRKTVLLVDDEDPILLGLHRILHEDNDTTDVLLARDGQIAQEIMASHAVDLVITDVRMPGMSGLELLCWTAAKSPNTRGIIMTGYDISGLETEAYRCGCLRIVQKPFDLHEMHQTAREALDDSSAFRGSLRSLSPADLVQMICLSGRTNVLRVAAGDDSGVVHVRQGEVVHAVWNDTTGEQAFYRLVQAQEGVFDTLPLPAEGPVTIQAGWQHLLIEAMRLDDERRAGMSDSDTMPKWPLPEETQEPLAPQQAAPADSPADESPNRKGSGAAWDAAVSAAREGPVSKEQLPELIDRGFTLVQRRRYDEARDAWRSALDLDPGNRLLELNLRKLESMRGAKSS